MSSERLSRRQLAQYAVTQITAKGDATHAVDQIAAYLVESGRTNEVDLITREIEDQLAGNGEVVADITTAHELDQETREKLTQFITETSGAQHVHTRETVEPSMIGGVRLQYGGKELDTTVRAKLKKLIPRNA